MHFADVFVEHLFLYELHAAFLALHPLPVVDQLHVPVEVVLVPKAHDALLALVVFNVGVEDHVPFEMGTSFECFIAVLLFALVGAGFGMALGYVAIEVTDFLEGFLADVAYVGFCLGQIRKSMGELGWGREGGRFL